MKISHYLRKLILTVLQLTNQSKISHQAIQWYKTVFKIIKTSTNRQNKEDNNSLKDLKFPY